MTAAPEVVAARGDAALAERIVADLGVATDPATAVDAGVTAYLGHLTSRLVRAVAEGLFGLLDAVPLPPGGSRALAWGLGLAAATLVILGVVRVLRRRRRRSPGAAAEAPEVVPGTAEERVAADRDAAGWRGEIDSLLAAGRAGEALSALWWWLARILAGEGADPSWTGRELLERAGRPELLPQVRRLEAFTYGRRRPEPSDLRRLVAEIEGVLP